MSGTTRDQTGAMVQVQQSAVVNITLRVGQSATEVSVQAVPADFDGRNNVDFFNVFNHPGNPSGVASTGILSTRNWWRLSRADVFET